MNHPSSPRALSTHALLSAARAEAPSAGARARAKARMGADLRARLVARIAAPTIGALPPLRTLGAAVAVLAVVASIGWGSRTPASFDSQTVPAPRMARCVDGLEGPAPFAVSGGCPGVGEGRFLSAGEGSSGAIGSSSG